MPSHCPRRARTAPAWCSCRTIDAARTHCKAIVERIIGEEGQALLGWREVPINLTKIGQERRVGRAGV